MIKEYNEQEVIITHNIKGMTSQQLNVLKSCIDFCITHPQAHDWIEEVLAEADFDTTDVLYSLEPNLW
mgnify:CR=1 FL=1